MATAIVMPKLSFVVTEGTILEWLKQPGDKVDKGEPLLVIESEKASIDVESPEAGILGPELAPVGTTVPVTTTIGYIVEPGEEAPPLDLDAQTIAPDSMERNQEAEQPAQEPASAEPEGTEHERRIKASPSAKRVAREHDVNLADIEGTGPGGRIVKQDVLDYVEARIHEPEERDEVVATPVARNLASHLGVDLNEIAGTGPGDRITSEDVRHAAEEAPQVSDHHQVRDQEEALSSIQRVAAERMSFSFRETPHFYLNVQVDMTQSMGMREQLLPVIESRTGVRLSFSDILLFAVSRALRKYPTMNASYDDGMLIKHQAVNVGLAVDTPRGLTVPVIHNAHQLSLEEIARQREIAVDKARHNRLSPEDLSDGTFTVSNLGMFGVDVFGAIINPPEAGILAVGSIEKRPVVVADQLTIRPTMWLTLSVDHRVTDGASAARFLQTLVSYLEAPYQLLI